MGIITDSLLNKASCSIVQYKLFLVLGAPFLANLFPTFISGPFQDHHHENVFKRFERACFDLQKLKTPPATKSVELPFCTQYTYFQYVKYFTQHSFKIINAIIFNKDDFSIDYNDKHCSWLQPSEVMTRTININEFFSSKGILKFYECCNSYLPIDL